MRGCFSEFIILETLREHQATTFKWLDMARIVFRDGKDFCLDCNEYITNIREHIETRHADLNQT